MQNTLKIEGYELLTQKVYRVLKTEIVKEFLEPGTKLLENKLAKEMHISRTPVREAILKQESPSCGCGRIYDGTFSYRLIRDDGVTTVLLKKNKIKVITEEDL